MPSAAGQADARAWDARVDAHRQRRYSVGVSTAGEAELLMLDRERWDAIGAVLAGDQEYVCVLWLCGRGGLQ